MSLNHELAAIFSRMAAILEIKGEVAFKSLAFHKVSRVLKDMTFDIRQAHDKGELADVEGIGKSSRKVIEEYIKTGRSVDYDELSASVPAGLLPLLEVPGLGPKTIALLWKERKITGEAELLKAIDDGALKGVKGLGEKKIEAIKQGIAFRAQSAGRVGIGEALPIAAALLERLRKLKAVKRAEVAGSLRRRRETIGDVDLLCSLKDGKGDAAARAAEGGAVAEEFVKFPEVERVLGRGNTKASVLTVGGLQVDLRIVPDENFGAALQYFTGSKDHNKKMRGWALEQGLTLNEWGLYRLEDYDKAEKTTGEAPAAKPVASKTEDAIYEKLGLRVMPPEMREDRGELEASREGTLPKLITSADIRGDLHTHTNASDGVATIEEMAEAAMKLGYEYLAITDHSKSQVIANGLSVDRLLKHVKAIHKVGDRLKGITLLAGCEVDILADGAMDYEDSVLAELDVVVGSPHHALKQEDKKATDRLRRAIDNRYVNIIGHPTGRLINSREGLSPDFAPLFKAAAANGTAMEINAGYPRLDLNEINARAAIEAGVMLSIDTDAHSTDGLGGLEWGLGVARRAWVTAGHVINCLPAKELLAFLKKKR